MLIFLMHVHIFPWLVYCPNSHTNISYSFSYVHVLLAYNL
uniref:Uncharacterized protein n=1 Tax=Rhizophora mucronata TaxID=61149 RepID=A0A2P2NNL6_RHIMU